MNKQRNKETKEQALNEQQTQLLYLLIFFTSLPHTAILYFTLIDDAHHVRINHTAVTSRFSSVFSEHPLMPM